MVQKNIPYAYGMKYAYGTQQPQYEYNILVITQVRGEAEDAGDNKGIVRVYWGITILYPTHQSPVELLSDVQTFLYS